MQRPSPNSGEPVTPVLASLISEHGEGAWIPLDVFVDGALYAPETGYYRRAQKRIGYGPERDFYTASALGATFSALVLAAIKALLPAAPGNYSFVEIGCEPGRGILHQRDHDFAAQCAIRVDEPLHLSGPCIIFSNELFDAQPFRRFQFLGGGWQEIGVRLHRSGPALAPAPTRRALPADLPPTAPDGYCLDYPSGAARLVQQIAAEPWHGLFVAFDYGLPWATLTGERPEGTARTYRQHRLGADLLAAPGEYDITHHICWDHLIEALSRSRFAEPVLESQESFFMHHAVSEITRLIAADAGGFSAERQTLKELLHPENMGRKFQVLHAYRAG